MVKDIDILSDADKLVMLFVNFCKLGVVRFDLRNKYHVQMLKALKEDIETKRKKKYKTRVEQELHIARIRLYELALFQILINSVPEGAYKNII